MKIPFILNNKKYLIRSMITREELDILEYLYTCDNPSQDELECILSDFLNYFNINNNILIENIIIFLKIREYSIGDDIEVKFKCDSCKNPQTAKIKINNIIKLATIHDSKIHGIYNENEIPKLEDLIKEDDLQELEWDEYNFMSKNIKDYLDLYNFTPKVICPYCGKEITLNISSLKTILSFVSDESFISLSKAIHTLTYFEHNGRNDILQMTPIQRILEMQNLKNTQKEIAEQTKKMTSSELFAQRTKK